MITGTCHCQAVSYRYHATPPWALKCNCSICRRLGALWIYAKVARINILGAAGTTRRYLWGDRKIAFHSCRTCGCTTHWENLDDPVGGRMAVNLNLADPEVAEGISVRRFDGASSWQFLD
ncbi:GFA family protein [Rhodovibrionaceae bacterium A322]